MKKCKKIILNNNDLHSLIDNIKNIFYEILKEFDRRSLEDIFDYYYETHDINNSLYSFIEKFVPIINFYYLKIWNIILILMRKSLF